MKDDRVQTERPDRPVPVPHVGKRVAGDAVAALRVGPPGQIGGADEILTGRGRPGSRRPRRPYVIPRGRRIPRRVEARPPLTSLRALRSFIGFFFRLALFFAMSAVSFPPSRGATRR